LFQPLTRPSPLKGGRRKILFRIGIFLIGI
jgi:hypothetical protein